MYWHVSYLAHSNAMPFLSINSAPKDNKSIDNHKSGVPSFQKPLRVKLPTIAGLSLWAETNILVFHSCI